MVSRRAFLSLVAGSMRASDTRRQGPSIASPRFASIPPRAGQPKPNASEAAGREGVERDPRVPTEGEIGNRMPYRGNASASWYGTGARLGLLSDGGRITGVTDGWCRVLLQKLAIQNPCVFSVAR
jgi:hypothetical protein